MPLAYTNEEHNPVVVAFCAEAIARGVNLNVDSRDEMLMHLVHRHGADRDQGLAIYFQSGMTLWTTLREVIVWWFGDLSRLGRLLDFASGYGRVSRFLVRDIPPERVWVSDIYAGGVRFQEEQFGVHGLVSTADPAEFAHSESCGRFDCILVSSLFTHLPEATFEPWLARLGSLLAPEGLLAFSTHGESLLPIGERLGPNGFRFKPVSESGSLDREQYGSTWVSEEYVRSCLARVLPGASARRIPKGLVSHQDLWVVVRSPEADFSGLDVTAHLDGYVEHCSLAAPDRLEIAGWVVDRVGCGPAQEVWAELDGAIVARCRDLPFRQDVEAAFPGERLTAQGWRLPVPLPSGLLIGTTPLVLRVVDAQGRPSAIAASSVESAMLRSARLDLLTTRVQLAEAYKENARLGESEARLGWEVAARDARIAAMEASRFWKLRRQWFALKRRLGLRAEE